MTPTRLFPLACLLASLSPAAHAVDLDAAVRTRVHGDRTGACLAVALIDDRDVRTTVQCADARRARTLDARSAFEIGSVSKTMTAVLLARLIEQGRASLDDPLAKHLPPGTVVPGAAGRVITLRDVVTHTSGLPALPPGFAPADMADPYASLTPQALLAALGQTTLSRAPGTQFEYSNFAMLLLSLAVSRTAGADYPALLQAQLLAPLHMDGTYVTTPPAGVVPAAGHTASGATTAPWTFAPTLAGVGGVRATLADMTRYVQAQWTPTGDAVLDRALARARVPLPVPGAPDMAMNWMRMPSALGTVYTHEGGTGGFSSLVAFAPDRRRGVVVLSDTALTSVGGLGALGLHLLDPAQPAPVARRTVAAPPALVRALAGEYTLENGMPMRLTVVNGALQVQAAGQPDVAMAYDSGGDFHPTVVDALLRPRRLAGGGYAFDWHQGGGVLRAMPVAAPVAKADTAAPPVDLQAYVGVYPLVPQFGIAILVKDGVLHVQGTGQPAVALAHVQGDTFVADAVGAELRFERAPDGRVAGVTLVQGGQQLRGARTP